MTSGKPLRRTIVITGASSGLGAEMARQLADAGHDLGLCARRTDKLEALRDEILAAHPERRVELRALDVTDADATREVFGSFHEALGSVDRVIVNAGLGKGAQIGSGLPGPNRETVETNVLGALATTEAAMELFRAAGGGHLVMVSSMSALRGLPKTLTTYAATKAFVAHLAEGLRTELHGREGYAVTVLYPGYIISEMNDYAKPTTPLMATTERGVRAMVAAIEKEVDHAHVPRLPWEALAPVMKHAPLPVFKRLI